MKPDPELFDPEKCYMQAAYVVVGCIVAVLVVVSLALVAAQA